MLAYPEWRQLDIAAEKVVGVADNIISKIKKNRASCSIFYVIKGMSFNFLFLKGFI